MQSRGRLGIAWTGISASKGYRQKMDSPAAAATACARQNYREVR